MSATITESAVGKRVVDASGRPVGIVSDVKRGIAYVNVDPSLSDRLRARLQWGRAKDDDYPVDASGIAAVSRDQIVLRENF